MSCKFFSLHSIPSHVCKSFQKLKIYMKLLGLNMRCYCHKCRKNNLLIHAQEKKKKKNWYEGEGMEGPLPHPSLSSIWLQCICGNAIVLPLSLIHVFFWVFGEKDTLHMKPAHTLRIGLPPQKKKSIKIQQCQPKSKIHTFRYSQHIWMNEWMNI